MNEVVRRLTIKATSTGIDEQTAKLNKLTEANKQLAVVTDTTAKKALSAEAAYNRQTLALDPAARAQASIARATKTADTALAQGIITKAAYAKRVQDITAKYTQMGVVQSELRNRMQGLAGSFGVVGQVLMSMGTAGLAAAAALGVLTVGFTLAASAALSLADMAGKLTDFGETTGFNVIQLQALTKAGEQVGVSSEHITRGLERFSMAMDDIKKGTGSAYESILEINPALAKQLTEVNSLTDGWDVFGRAIKSADLEQANKLARSVFGRTGIPQTRLLRAGADAGGLAGLVQQLKEVDRITIAQAEKWDLLGDNIASNMRLAKQNIAAIFTEPVLIALHTFSRGFLELSRIAKEFTLSAPLQYFLGAMANIVAGPAIIAGKIGAKLFPEAPKDNTLDFNDRFSNVPSGNAVDLDTYKQENVKRSLATSIAEQERWNSALGAAVTPAQTLKLSIDKLNLAAMENKISNEQAAAGMAALNAQYSSSQFSAYIGLLGQSATVQDQVQAKRNQMNDAARMGVVLSKSERDNQLRLTESQALGTFQLDAQTAAETTKTQTLLMGEKAAMVYLLVQTKINEQRALGVAMSPAEVASFQASAEAMAQAKVEGQNYAEILGTMKNAAGAFANTFISGLVSGKSIMQSLGQAATQLSQTLTNSAITQALSGNFVGAAISGIGAVISGIFGASQEEDEENARRAQAAAEAAAKAIKDAQDRTKQYNDMAATSGFDTSTVAGQIAAFDAQAQQTRADEAEKGNGAILALENSLAKQRAAIVDKANQAITKSLNDFLNSIKTGANSILSPEDQLKYAQERFNADVTAANGGDEAALGRITQDAQSLLDLAKAFYASSTGYTTIYQSVTDAVAALANRSNITVGALAANTTRTPEQLQAENLKGFAGGRLSGSSELNDTMVQDAINYSGIGYAAGGIVGNGRFNVDSVLASYAGGGNIKLAGGEHVTRATSVNNATRSSLDFINRTGKTPGGDNSEVVRVLAQGFNGQTTVLADKLDNIANRLQRLEDTTRQTNNQRRVPGSTMKAA